MNKIRHVTSCFSSNPEYIPLAVIFDYVVFVSYTIIGVVLIRKAVKYLLLKEQVIKIPNSPSLVIHSGLFFLFCSLDHLFEAFNLTGSLFPFILNYPSNQEFNSLLISGLDAFLASSFSVRMAVDYDFKNQIKKFDLGLQSIQYRLFESDIPDKIPAMVFLVNNKGEFVDVNNYAAKKLGYERWELKGVNFNNLVSPTYRKGTQAVYSDPQSMGDYRLVYNQYITKTGDDLDMYWIRRPDITTTDEIQISIAIDDIKVLNIKEIE